MTLILYPYMSMGGSPLAKRYEFLRVPPYAYLPRHFDLGHPKSTPQFHVGVHFPCLCRFNLWPRKGSVEGFRVLLQTILRVKEGNYHAIVGYFDVIDYEDYEPGKAEECRNCPRKLKNTCRASRFLKVHFKEVNILQEPYILKPKEISEILGKEKLRRYGPYLKNLELKRFYNCYQNVAYLWQRWLTYNKLLKSQSILNNLIEEVLDSREIIRKDIENWRKIIKDVVNEIKRDIKRWKEKKNWEDFMNIMKFTKIEEFLSL